MQKPSFCNYTKITFDTVSCGIMVIDKNAIIRCKNKAMDFLLERDSDNSGTWQLKQLFPDDFLKIFNNYYKEVLQNKTPKKFDSIPLMINQSKKYVSCDLTPIFDNKDFIGITCSFVDITHAQIIQKAYQETNILLSSIIDSSNDIIIFALDKRYCYTAFNSNHKKTMKKIWDADIEVGINMLNIITNDQDRLKAKKNFDRVLSGESFIIIEQYGQDPNRFYYEDIYSPIRNQTGEVVGLTLFLKDITEKIKAEKELKRLKEELETKVKLRTNELYEVNQQLQDEIRKERIIAKKLSDSELRFKSIFESAADCIFIKNRNLKYIRANKAACDIFGIPESALIGYSDIELFGKENAKIMNQEDLKVLKGEIVKSQNTNQFQGENLTFDVVKFPLEDEQGNIVSICGIARDITLVKQYEDKIVKSLKEKEILFKEIHHRVKNNLQIISSFLDLQIAYSKDTKSSEILQNCQNRIRTMSLIHEELFQTIDSAQVNISQYLKRITYYLTSVYSEISQNIDIEFNLENINIELDNAIPCGLIVCELISNACKYAFIKKERGKILLNFLKKDKGYLLIVADNGSGLPKDFTIDKVNSLGLQIVRLLTKQLDGNIEVINENGTEIRISFHGV